MTNIYERRPEADEVELQVQPSFMNSVMRDPQVIGLEDQVEYCEKYVMCTYKRSLYTVSEWAIFRDLAG